MKPKTCPVCRIKFEPSKPLQKCCGWECAQVYGRMKRVKEEVIKDLADRKVLKAKKEALKSRSEWMRDAQKAFNAFIRYRDMVNGYPCISSWRALDWSGNAVDAGHYRSVGSAPHLRFNEDNVHAQSKHDNRYGSGNAVDYRIGLIARIGIKRVEALEADQTPRKYSIEDLKAIKALYVAKLKELKSKSI